MDRAIVRLYFKHPSHQRNGIEGNIPEIHETEHVHQDHGDGEKDEDGRIKIESQQDEGDKENSAKRSTEVLRRVFDNR